MAMNVQQEVSRLAAMGFALLPLPAGRKTPPPADWQHDAHWQDGEYLRWYWRQHPTSNIALPAGLNNVIVLDLDVHNRGRLDKPDCPADCPSDGMGWLAKMRATYGTEWLQTVPVVQSPTGGLGLVFVAPEGTNFNGSAGKLGKHVDTRAGVGYYLLPPSTHPNGGMYQWAVGAPDLSMIGNGAPLLPTWIWSKLQPKPAPAASERATPRDRKADYCPRWLLKQVDQGATQGERNDEACRVACSLIEEVADSGEQQRLMVRWAAACQPPVPATEALKRLRWAERHTRYSPWQPPARPTLNTHGMSR